MTSEPFEAYLIASLQSATPNYWIKWGELALGGLTVDQWKNGDGGSWDGIDTELAALSPVQAPDYILVNIGRNDMGSMPTEANFKADFGYCLDAMHAKWIRPVIVEIPWRGDSDYDSEADTIAGWITDVNAARDWSSNGPDERVYFKPNVATYSTDNIHIDTVAGAQARAAQLQASMGY